MIMKIIICSVLFILPLTTGCYSECCYDRIFDCRGYHKIGHNSSGVYYVTPLNIKTHYEVYCDMKTDGGGWLVTES